MLRRPSIQALFDGYEFDASSRELKPQPAIVQVAPKRESQSAYLPRR